MKTNPNSEISHTITSGYMKVGAQQGWQCPVCGIINSPWTAQCPCHGNPNWITTITSTTQPNGESYTYSLCDEHDSTEKDK